MKNMLLSFMGCFLSLLIVSAGWAEEKRMMPRHLDGGMRPCLDCHRSPNIDTNAGALASQTFCLECHAEKGCTKEVNKRRLSLQVSPESLLRGKHGHVACIQCHRDVAQCPHSSKQGAQCRECHPVHGEAGPIHIPHLRVRCQACHSTYTQVALNKNADEVVLAHVDAKKNPLALTDHKLQDTDEKDFCQRCHHIGNPVGAAAVALPSKSVICILCHYSPIAAGNFIFGAALIIFLLGVIMTVRFWFKGSAGGEEESLHRKISHASESIWRVIFSREILSVLKVIFLDIFLQRRILKESVKRWSIHSLIYLSILGRFFLSLFTYFAYGIAPDSTLALALINKNIGFTAFVYDLLGLFIVLGLVWAIVERFIVRPVHSAREGQDIVAIMIIGVLVLLGFFLEGARILMTQIPPEKAVYSFIGYPVAKLIGLLNPDWKDLYPYLWYAHAVFGALLIAYLPFGKMRHVFNTPLTLIMNKNMK